MALAARAVVVEMEAVTGVVARVEAVVAAAMVTEVAAMAVAAMAAVTKARQWAEVGRAV